MTLPSVAADPDATAGAAAVAAAARAGVRTMFTLSGAHVFPLYDAAHRGAAPLRMIDVRHEASAVFAAEAVGKLTRTPGFAVVTAGPGVTNAVSPVTQAHFSGAPVVVFGGRAPELTWGRGALQEMDQAPLFTTITKSSATAHTPDEVGALTAAAFTAASTAHRGPAFVEAGIDVLFAPAGDLGTAEPGPGGRPAPDEESVAEIARLLREARRPIVILGSDVWADGAEQAALDFVTALDLPAIGNGMGRGILPPTHPGCVTRARRAALTQCDVAIVVGAPLDFRIGYGTFGPAGTDTPVIHIADSTDQIATHRTLAASAAGDLGGILRTLCDLVGGPGGWREWRSGLREQADAAGAADAPLLTAGGDLIHPARIYGELLPRLGDDAIVIGDGGDFVSWAGRFVQPARPGRWLDPGPFGCLGAGLGAAIGARAADPDAPIVLLLGDGAAGMSLMDLDTLVRHDLPVVIVVGNNSAWGLEKGPMQLLYGYDILADLAPGTRYDKVASALGGASELVDRPGDIGPALDRALASGTPYLLNVLTDPAAAYPRSTTGL
ncbi:MAG TPA: acetolactate synthase [Tetrasphaera sp.]|nr:acetolactate synthase [Tetrasphaera sp.]